MWDFIVGLLFGALCFLLVLYIKALRAQVNRAVADYIKLSDMLINYACPDPHGEINKGCHHQKLLWEHRLKGCTIINDN